MIEQDPESNNRTLWLTAARVEFIEHKINEIKTTCARIEPADTLITLAEELLTEVKGFKGLSYKKRTERRTGDDPGTPVLC